MDIMKHNINMYMELFLTSAVPAQNEPIAWPPFLMQNRTTPAVLVTVVPDCHF